MQKHIYDLNSVVELKKGHPCGANEWKVIRMGADIKVKCLGCDRVVMIRRHDFDKRIKKIIE